MYRKAQLAALVFALAVTSLWPTSAHAHRPAIPSMTGVGGYFHDPFFGPLPGYPSQYPPPPYYGAYRRDSSVRVVVTPREAEVYVDGYYAGIVDDFDGFFQRLRLPPGDHEVTLYREGYRSVHRKIYLTPDSTYKLVYTMEKLAPGDIAEPRPAPAARPPNEPDPARVPPAMRRGAPPPGMPPRGMPPRQMPPPDGPAGEASSFGTLVIRVHPPDAEVLIDGERWRGPAGPDQRLIVQVAEGAHRVEIRKDGYQTFSTEISVRRGETAPLNVSLPEDRR